MNRMSGAAGSLLQRFLSFVARSTPLKAACRPKWMNFCGPSGGLFPIRQLLVILSPHEVNELLPEIRKSEHIHLHLYTPRTTKSMVPSDNLRLYSIPAVSANWTPPQALVSQPNVFAGQLYFSDHAAYIQLCRFLCVYAQDLQDEDDMIMECDGFITPEQRRGPASGQAQRTFQNTPLPFVKVLLGLRRKRMSFAQTHMGKLLDGRLLAERDFERVENVRLYFDRSSVVELLMFGIEDGGGMSLLANSPCTIHQCANYDGVEGDNNVVDIVLNDACRLNMDRSLSELDFSISCVVGLLRATWHLL